MIGLTIREYEAIGPEAAELRAIISEAIAAALAPEIEIVVATDWTAIDEAWFSAGAAVENLLARQGTNPGKSELDPCELEALRASERSRGE